jgi:hypothetical protein
MRQNKVPRTEPSKPYTYHYPTRNMSPSTLPGTVKDAKALFLYPYITQLCYAAPGAIFKRKNDIEKAVNPKTDSSDCNRLQ